MKKLLALVMALSLVVFVGCSGKDKKDSTGSPTATQKGTPAASPAVSPKPPVPPKPEAKTLKATAPATVTVKQGGTADVKISVEQTGIEDDVKVTFDKLPDGVTVEKDESIKKGAKEATITLKADADAKEGDHKVMVTTTAGAVKDTAEITIKVEKK